MGQGAAVRETPLSSEVIAIDDQADGEEIVRSLIVWMGRDPAHSSLVDTPRRVLDAWREMLAGYRAKPEELLGVTFEAACDEMVVLRDIPFHSTCEHHLLPFTGRATVGYLPGCDGRVVGISKLARLVECYARRLQLQERMTRQVADAIVEHLDAAGVGVVVEAEHMCMVCRGVAKAGATMRTTALRGAFREDAAVRSEFMEAL
jgi:GTP cyclohydrolase I